MKIGDKKNAENHWLDPACLLCLDYRRYGDFHSLRQIPDPDQQRLNALSVLRLLWRLCCHTLVSPSSDHLPEIQSDCFSERTEGLRAAENDRNPMAMDPSAFPVGSGHQIFLFVAYRCFHSIPGSFSCITPSHPQVAGGRLNIVWKRVLENIHSNIAMNIKQCQ